MKIKLLPLLCASLLHGQSFDVASVKRSPASSQFSFSPLTGGKITAHDAGVRDLIRAAYRILDFQISGAPNWLESEKYDVDAKSDQPADAMQTRLMLQALLADRFQLKFRRESKEMTVLALTVAKGSEARLTPADASGCDLDPAAASPCGGLTVLPGYVITYQKVTMPQFAIMLGALLGQPLKEETGLSGVFDFKLDLGSAGFAPTSESTASEVDRLNAFMNGLRDQLGLKLERTRSTVEMFVIEHVERPSPN
jgi:uncharacterized protein (TIGR03435 family)